MASRPWIGPVSVTITASSTYSAVIAAASLLFHEGKAVLKGVQEFVAEQQAAEFLQRERTCNQSKNCRSETARCSVWKYLNLLFIQPIELFPCGHRWMILPSNPRSVGERAAGCE